MTYAEYEVLYDTYAPVLYGWLLRRPISTAAAQQVLHKTFVEYCSHYEQYATMGNPVLVLVKIATTILSDKIINTESDTDKPLRVLGSVSCML